MTDCVGSAARIADAVQGLLGTRAAMHVADELAAAWRLGSRFAERYALAKREAGLADFDDLITLAGALLRVSSFGEWVRRSEEHTSELQSLMRISYAVFCLKKKKTLMEIIRNWIQCAIT